MRENTLRKRVMRRLQEVEGSWWESIQQAAIRGTPDVLGVVRGRFVALEFKSSEGALTALQRHKLLAIRAAGGGVYLVNPENEDVVVEELWKKSRSRSGV